MATTRPKLITADELLELYGKGVRGELIRGVLCETMPSGGEHGEIVMSLGAELKQFIKAREAGQDYSGQTPGSVSSAIPTRYGSRTSPISPVKGSPWGTRVTGFYETVPDLVVEVASPSNSHWELNDKALMWLHYGVRLVWVVYPDTRNVTVYRANHRALTLSDEDALDGLDVLPGFTCVVSEIFDT